VKDLKVSKPGNSLAEKNPLLASEFNLQSNFPLTPKEVSASSKCKVWWKCNDCDHEWLTGISNRHHGKKGCSVCKGMAVHSDGRNSMAKIRPDLASEFHFVKNAPLTPDVILPGTRKKLWWKCNDCNHEWEAVSAGRHHRNYGCTACSGHAVHIDKRNSMAKVRPEAVIKFDFKKNFPVTPENLLPFTMKKLWWKCEVCDYEFYKTANARKIGCAVCANKIIHPDGRNSMSVTHPKLAEEFDKKMNYPLIPKNIIAGSLKKYWWICKICNHNWQALSSSRRRGVGCPVCANRVVHEDGRNSFANTHPHLAIEFDLEKNFPKNPENLISGNNNKFWWRCSKCENEWKASLVKRTLDNRGCPSCTLGAGGLHSDGRNSLAKTHPEIAKDWHPTLNGTLTAEKVRVGSRKSVFWRCTECSHECKNGIEIRSRGGCPVCSVNALHSDGINAMASTHPHLIEEFDFDRNYPLTPDDIVAGTNKKLHWICAKCKFKYIAVGTEKAIQKTTDCQACRNRHVKPDGSNSMAKTHPRMALEFNLIKNSPDTPETLTAGTGKNLYWKCSQCEHEWRQKGAVRSHQNVNCPNCAPLGFRPGEEGYYYCMEMMGPDEIWWYKGGISHKPKRRLRNIQNSLNNQGMNLEVNIVSHIFFKDGKDAVALERKLLQTKSIRIKTLEKFDGSNELFSVNPIEYAKSMNWIKNENIIPPPFDEDE